MQNMRILIVEDELNIAKTIEAAFSQSEHYTKVCYDGDTAVQQLQAEKWDVAFLDIKLPGINGMEILKHIHEQQINVQAVMVTAYGSVEFAVQAMKYGAVDFIEKPFEPDTLRNIVKTIAQRLSLEEKLISEYHQFIELSKKQISDRDYPQASATIKKAIALKPESAEAYNLLGAVTEIMDDVPAAVQFYQMAVRFDPNYRPALENIKRITTIDTAILDVLDLMDNIKRD